MPKQLRRDQKVELCEYYEDRFSIEELAIIYEISKWQVKSILEQFKVPERTEPL